MALLCVSVLASQVEILPNSQSLPFTFSVSYVNKKNLIESFISRAGLMTFRHNFPNRHPPDFHFLEFFVYSFSTTSHSESTNTAITKLRFN